MSDSSSSTSSSDFALLEQLSDWESDSDSAQQNTRSHEERVNYLLKYEDSEFVYRFRLNKAAVEELLTEIYPFLKVTSKR